MCACEVDLVIVLGDLIIVDEHKLGDDRAGLQRTMLVEVRDVADNEAVAVERDRIAAFDEPAQVGVTTDQFRKH